MYDYRVVFVVSCCVFFFKQKTAYDMRISDWSSDVCSSDLIPQLWDIPETSGTSLPSAVKFNLALRFVGFCSTHQCCFIGRKRGSPWRFMIVARTVARRYRTASKSAMISNGRAHV